MFLVNEPRPSGQSGRGGGPNVIVGCVHPLNGRPQHLIEAAKRGRLDQMLLLSAPLTTRAPRTTVWPDVAYQETPFLDNDF